MLLFKWNKDKLNYIQLCRESDELCDELDEAPGIDKMEKFRERWECISNSSSNLIKQKLKPRIAFTGSFTCYKVEAGTFVLLIPSENTNP